MSSEAKIAKIEEYGVKKKYAKVVGFLKHKEPELRAAAADALKNFPTDECYNELIILLRDPDLSVQKAAVSSLQAIGRKEAVEHLRHEMNTAKDESLKAACQQAIHALSN